MRPSFVQVVNIQFRGSRLKENQDRPEFVLRGDLLLWALGCASGCTDRWMVLIAGFPTHHLRAPELQYSRQRVYVFGDSLKVKDVCDETKDRVRGPRSPPAPLIFKPLREYSPAVPDRDLPGARSYPYQL